MALYILNAPGLSGLMDRYPVQVVQAVQVPLEHCNGLCASVSGEVLFKILATPKTCTSGRDC
jgi:hypothetical protein